MLLIFKTSYLVGVIKQVGLTVQFHYIIQKTKKSSCSTSYMINKFVSYSYEFDDDIHKY